MQAQITEWASPRPPFLPIDPKVTVRAAEGALVDVADVVESLLRSLGDTLAGAVRLLIGGKVSERSNGVGGFGGLRGTHSPSWLGGTRLTSLLLSPNRITSSWRCEHCFPLMGTYGDMVLCLWVLLHAQVPPMPPALPAALEHGSK